MTGKLEALISEKECARLLGVCVSNLRRRRQLKQPPQWVKIGGRVLYQPDILRSFIRTSIVFLPPVLPREEE